MKQSLMSISRLYSNHSSRILHKAASSVCCVRPFHSSHTTALSQRIYAMSTRDFTTTGRINNKKEDKDEKSKSHAQAKSSIVLPTLAALTALGGAIYYFLKVKSNPDTPNKTPAVSKSGDQRLRYFIRMLCKSKNTCYLHVIDMLKTGCKKYFYIC